MDPEASLRMWHFVDRHPLFITEVDRLERVDLTGRHKFQVLTGEDLIALFKGEAILIVT